MGQLEISDEMLINVALDGSKLNRPDAQDVCQELFEARLALRAIATTPEGAPNGSREGRIARAFIAGILSYPFEARRRYAEG